MDGWAIGKPTAQFHGINGVAEGQFQKCLKNNLRPRELTLSGRMK
jgi:hypothetical protein